MLSGSMPVDYGDRTENYGRRDAFSMTPGHVPSAEAGSEFVMFSSKDQLEATNTAIQTQLRQLQQAGPTRISG